LCFAGSAAARSGPLHRFRCIKTMYIPDYHV